MTKEKRLIKSVEHYAQRFNITDEDVIQDAYVYVLEHEGLYPQSQVAYDYFRRVLPNKKTATATEKLDGAHYSAVRMEEECHTLAASILAPYIMEALAHLTPFQSAVLQMRHGLNGYPVMPFSAIAESFGVCPQTASNVYGKALRRLRREKFGVNLKFVFEEVQGCGLC